MYVMRIWKDILIYLMKIIRNKGSYFREITFYRLNYILLHQTKFLFEYNIDI